MAIHGDLNVANRVLIIVAIDGLANGNGYTNSQLKFALRLPIASNKKATPSRSGFVQLNEIENYSRRSILALAFNASSSAR